MQFFKLICGACEVGLMAVGLAD